MRREFKVTLSGDESRENGTASFTLPFDTREVWGKAKVPVKVTINGYTWRSTVGNRGGIQYIVVNAAARLHAGVAGYRKAGHQDSHFIAESPRREAHRKAEHLSRWKASTSATVNPNSTLPAGFSSEAGCIARVVS